MIGRPVRAVTELTRTRFTGRSGLLRPHPFEEQKDQRDGLYRRRREEPARAHWRRHDGLQEGAGRTGGDFEAAIDALRAKGLAAAAKKSSRTAAEGLVGVAVAGTKGVAVEVNSETDFVAKNEQFQDFVRKATEVALNTAAPMSRR
jgi:hypothetical protein